MHTLASYLLEANLPSNEAATVLRGAAECAADEWLSQKGASEPRSDQGTFSSLTPGSTGNYTRAHIRGEDAKLAETRLEEFSKGGQIFSTSISIVTTKSKVKIFVTQSVGSVESVIAPVAIDPRCPGVVRRFLQLTPEWKFGGRDVPLPVPTAMHGGQNGLALGELIGSESRAIPLMVVSQNEGQPIWPRIAEDLAYDLTALAGVVTIDEEAAWALTSKLGKVNACYRGAIRLYWPTRQLPGELRFRNPLWTASTLLSSDSDGNGASRFRAIMRRTVMSVAALTVEPPSEIAELRRYVARRQLKDLEARVTSHSDELEMAREFFGENERLTADLNEARRDLAHWRSRAERAEYALDQKAPQIGDLKPDFAEDDEEPPPQPGEARFFKKSHSTPNHDVLIRVTDCGHAKWQASNKADKAKKGLEKLLGDDEWKSLQHCGTCTGGGMWRVKW